MYEYQCPLDSIATKLINQRWIIVLLRSSRPRLRQCSKFPGRYISCHLQSPYILIISNIQAVLADGSIINANLTSHPDLYWALRGGGSNFAIIIRFDFHSFPQGLLWGGIRDYGSKDTSFLIDQYVDFGYNASSFPSTYQITTLYYANASHTATVDLYNTQPYAFPSVFQPLLSLPALSDTTAIKYQSQIADENYAAQPDHYRQTYWTLTVRLDRSLAHYIHHVFHDETARLGNLTGLQARCIMQILTTDMHNYTRRRGGNPLPLSSYTEPLILLNPAYRWTDEKDDLRIMQANMNFVNRVSGRAREMGLDVPYLFMNYASQFQDVMHGYGQANLKKLRDVSRMYDPEGVFQGLQRGYFKLNGRVG